MAKSKPSKAKPTANGTHKPGSREAAYFLSLSLENVRCFGPKQTLDLSDGHGKPARWTIILGLNGTGKTTLLQSLVGFETLEKSSENETDELPQEFAYELRFTKKMNFYRSFGRVSKQGSMVLVANTSRSKSLDGQVLNSYYKKVFAKVKNITPRFNLKESSPWCCAYGANRRFGSTNYSDKPHDDPTVSIFSDKATLQNPQEWLLRLDYLASKQTALQAKRKDRQDQIEKLILSVMPEGEITEIKYTISTDINPVSRVVFNTPYGWVPLRQLGYGYQTLITWVADLAYRMVEKYPDSPDPLAEPAVVLVDEIDLHLHPQWQRKLVGFLSDRFPNTQFIATAHSPLMVQASKDVNLAVLKREGDHVVIDNDVDNIRSWRVDQILTSEIFGQETARPLYLEPLLKERVKLLSKSKLTKADEKRVKELEAEIGEMPTGDTAQEIKERRLLRETLDLLMIERQAKK